jgi:hypothetical protein
VRSHDWISLINNNFLDSHLDACNEGWLKYDLSPMALFDSKIILSFPYDDMTRHFYDDEIRSILPYTQVLRPEGIRLQDGSWASIDEICENKTFRKMFYAKYAGTDVNFNWGSRAVFYLGSGSRNRVRSLFEIFLADMKECRQWILQEAHRCPHDTTYIDRSGETVADKGYLKLSGFYGPNGLLGISAYHLRAPKVHGTSKTVVSIAY